MKRKMTAVLLTIAMSITMTACSVRAEKRYKASFLNLFDTVTEIVGFSESEVKFSEYSQIIYDNLNEYNRLYDIYHNYEGLNNLKTINDNAGIKPVKVDRKIIDLLLFSKKMYELTDGNVNIALGSVLSLWHEHRIAGLEEPMSATLPEYEELLKRAQHTDINRILIDEKASEVFLEDPEMRLDVGAVAKGYAVEKTAHAIEKAGFVNGMISVGGNIRTLGSKYDEKGKKTPWSVGIQNPDFNSTKKTLHVLNLSEGSLVTSGIYERYYIVDGKQYHHIIDPKTLRPAEYFVFVSIVCQDSGMADALSTAVFNMPFEEGAELIKKLDGVEAMWEFHDGTKMYSSGFKSMIKIDDKEQNLCS
ncbi:MAG: FAD:protein FMN transferase [Firmicutes bacterium HGW-Firmicutes-16]|nr:MAG: FAD:protein FMN transferase [Firmicutes bacterium HGW-Firmicutes-16]